MAGFILSSSAFADGEYLALEQAVNEEVGFGCAGGNVSPQLSWTDPPAGTKSLALTMFDPDAPTGSGFWHWLALNLPADLRELPAGAGTPGGAMPDGSVQARNDYGFVGYGGPCPPQGDHPHRYLFTLYAVSEGALPVTEETPCAVMGFQLNFNHVAKATLMGFCKR